VNVADGHATFQMIPPMNALLAEVANSIEQMSSEKIPGFPTGRRLRGTADGKSPSSAAIAPQDSVHYEYNRKLFVG